MIETKKIGDLTYVKCYGPNSVRYDIDDDVYRYAIYINNELYEICPLQTTKEDAEMRLHDIMDELGIEGNTEPIYKLIN